MTAQEDNINQVYDPTDLTTSNIRTLLSWRSPSRPWKARGKQFYFSAFLITSLISVIIFLFGEYTLVFATWALTFAAVALAGTKPNDVSHKITNQGITIDQHSYLWKELYDFYFKEQFGEDVLHVRTHALIPVELVITISPISKEHIREAMVHFLPFRESIERTFIDKAGDWLAQTFPLEKS